MTAEIHKLVVDVASRAFADCGQQQHGGDADRHGQQHQPGPGPGTAQCSHTEGEDISWSHRNVSQAATVSASIAPSCM